MKKILLVALTALTAGLVKKKLDAQGAEVYVDGSTVRPHPVDGSYTLSLRVPRTTASVEATAHVNDPAILAKVSRGLGAAIPGLEISKLETTYADRGW